MKRILYFIFLILFFGLVGYESSATEYYVGDGSDGDLVVSSTRTEDSVKSNITSTASSGQKDITLASASGFAEGDLIFIIQIQGTGAGNYEFNRIDSISENTVTVRNSLSNSYQSTGAQVIKVFEYSSVTINNGGVWEASSWDGSAGGVLVSVSTGPIILNTGGAVDMSGKGFRGGIEYVNPIYTGDDGWCGENQVSISSHGGPVGNGGGGAAQSSTPNTIMASGGGGGNGEKGTDGESSEHSSGGGGGEISGTSSLSTMVAGGGGGGGGVTPLCGASCGATGNGGGGGSGGGIIFLVSGEYIRVSSGSFNANGNSGTNGVAGSQNANPGGGGGGAGGSIRLISTETISLGTGVLNAIGATGGYGAGSGKTGGSGAVGRIATLSSATVTGSSNPTIDTSSTDTTITIDPFAKDAPPTVTTNTATSVTSSTASLNGTVNANNLSTTAWFEYGITIGSYSNTTSTQSVSGSSDTSVSTSISGLSSSTTYYYRVVAQNSAGTTYGSEASFTTSAPSDTTSPSGSISINSGASYTNTSTVTLSLSATDATGVTGYYLSTSSTTPSSSDSGWVSVSSTTSYSASVSYALSSGDGSKTIYVWYKDAAGNVSNSASASITLDTTAPTVSITSPTSDATYSTTSSAIDLSGSASDSTSGVSGVAWSNSTTGSSGTASGTTSWSVSNINLSEGSNSITVTATDNAGNTATDFITVSYSIPQPSPTPTPVINPPTVITGSATNVTENSATLNGTANANNSSADVWFEYGTTGGVYSLLSSTQSISGSGDTSVNIAINALSAGTTYYYRIAGQNSAGTSYGDEKSFTTASSCTDDYEPNEDFQNAYGPLESGKSYEGKLCSSEDKDYFKFEVENPNTIQLTLNVPSGNDYDLYLYDSSETEVSNSRTTEQTETITHNAISTGIYFIQVFGYGGAYDEDLPYTLAGTWTASLVPTPTLTPIPTSVATPIPNPTGTPAATGVIIGSVTDAVTSEPVRGATVSTDDGEYSATTNPAGRFTLSNIPTGSYTLTASVAGYESASQSVTVTAGAPTQANFSLHSLISPSPTPVLFDFCEVYGFITDEDDHDLSEVNVTIKGTKDSRSALTDEDGYFEFTGLKAGKYTVTYEKEGYRKQSEDITLIEGESRDLGIIVMEQNIAGIIYGTVTDAENDPIESAKVKLKSKGSNAKVKEKYTTSEYGTYEFTGLDEGTYIIQAKKKGYNKAKERIKLSDGEDKGVDLVLEEK